jgi:hypothetical protein
LFDGHKLRWGERMLSRHHDDQGMLCERLHPKLIRRYRQPDESQIHFIAAQRLDDLRGWRKEDSNY